MNAPDPAITPGAKLPPEQVALRAAPRPVMRLSRRTLVVIVGALSTAALGATFWSLHSAQRRQAAPPEEVHNVERVAHAEALARLPEDYTEVPPPRAVEELRPDVPELGEPLPGDLGEPMLRAEREAAGYGQGVDPAEAERLAKLKEAEEAMRSPVFFGGGGARAAPSRAEGAVAGLPVLPSSDPLAAAQAEAARTVQLHGNTVEGVPAERGSGAFQPPASPYQVMAGTVIAAALVTGIRSDLPGEVIATVTEPVYDTATGQHLLIPQGSRLLGRYDSEIGFGQSRVRVAWHRVILPDTSSLALDNLVGTDPSGYAGLEDDVDPHWGRLFAGAALSTLLGVSAELAAPENRVDGNRIVIAGRDSVQDSINQVGQELTRRNLDVRPTLTIRPGTPVFAIVGRDLTLRPYRPASFQGASR